MSAPDEGSSTTVLLEMKPGWIYVKIVEPRPEPDQTELLLRRAIERWFHTHPKFVIDKTQTVTEQGTLQGINVWYHDVEQQPVSGPEPSRQPFSLAFEVHDQIHRQLPKERIEAIVEEALQICRSREEWRGMLIVINPGGIAVILDKQANRGVVLPVELVYPALEKPIRQRVETWLQAPPTRRHVVQIDGSWFTPRKTEPIKGQIVESDLRSTNMTYDTGPNPGE